MFRFTIRELMLLTTIVATGLGWSAREQQLNARLLAASRVSEFLRSANHDLQIDFEVVQHCLSRRGLAIEWPNDSHSFVRKLEE